jgi:hypothetical protein
MARTIGVALPSRQTRRSHLARDRRRDPLLALVLLDVKRSCSSSEAGV